MELNSLNDQSKAQLLKINQEVTFKQTKIIKEHNKNQNDHTVRKEMMN